MNKFYIISNIDRDPGQEKASVIHNYLLAKGKSSDLCSLRRFSIGDEDANAPLNEIGEDVECAIVLGGDGTIIQVASEMAKKKIPVIGINLGRLGFLAEIDFEDVFLMLDKLIEDDFYLENRMMLEGTTVINDEVMPMNLALNDIVITRAGMMRVVDYDIYVNDKLLTTINGDGIVVSTPTGSTGYSMSAGGPIVEPDAMVILLTPISAHNLSSRPVVLSPDDVVKIKVVSDKYEDSAVANVSFDGGQMYEMNKDDFIYINKANVVTKVLKISKESFLDVLSRKLSS